MQAISKARHVHLVDALLQMEELLIHEQECNCLQQSAAYRRELENMHSNYERLLDELAKQITTYETLFGHVKVHFLSKKLKELKKEISVGNA